MLGDEPIPMVHFDGASIPAAHRLAAWSRLTPGYDVEPAGGLAAEDAELQSRAWLLDDLVVTTSQVSPLKIRRTPAHILADGRDSYSFILLKSGGWRGTLETGDVQVGSGQVCIMDFASTWEVEGTAQDNIMLVIPRSRVTAASPGAPPLHGMTLDGAGGRLLAEHLLALVRHLPDMKVRELPVLGEATLALVAVALNAVPRESAAAPRRPLQETVNRVRALIEQHLTSPGLSVELICRDAAVTRSTLYRAFAASGGIVTYIQRRRLEAAHARISDTSDRSTMADIADTFCFSNPAHFSTAFRRHFNYTPREARAVAPPSDDVSVLFGKWRRVIEDS